MMDLEFSFDKAPWEDKLMALQPGDTVSAVELLTLLEGETEDTVQNVLLELEARSVALDVTGLPKGFGNGEAALRLRREAELVKSGMLMQSLEENDPLRLYLEEVAGLPAAGDPQRMAERFAGGYDPVLPGLTNLMLPMVIEMAQSMTGYGVLLLDLIQEGSLGLWQGILSFQRGDFCSHAAWWIRQYLHKAVLLQARESGLGVKMKQAMEDYRSVDEKLLADLGRNPTVEEIAEEMHMTAQEAQMVADMLSAARMLSSAKQEMEEPEETPEDEQHVEDTAYFQSRQRVNDLLEGLNDTEAKLIALRFGLEGGKSLSTEETGRKLGLTPEEVVALETAALSKMRNSIPS
jgi:RNA polymerase primary sigma factor